MHSEIDHQVLTALGGFARSGIILVEWETPLLRRLGYPLAPKSDFMFLVPDDQLQEANQIAAASGLELAGPDDPPVGYLSEFAKQGTRYFFGEPASKSRFVLMPLGWTGIQRCQLSTIQTTDYDSPLPCTILTVPAPAFCAACLRIITREEACNMVRVMAMADLSAVIGYSMFDMSYEGSYLELPEDREDDSAVSFDNSGEDRERLEREQAVKKIEAWDFGEDESWARDTLIQLVSGQLQYDELPSKGA